MSTGMIIFLVVLVVLIGICVGLYFFGKKAEKKQAEQKEQMDAVAQTVSMLVIDKKRLKLKEAGLPAAVVENTPKYLRRTRVPIVKAKIGPKIMTLMCEEKVFSDLLYSPDHSSVITLPNFSFYTLFLPRTPEAPLTLLRQGDTGLLY